ncbi:MAG TPA: hypothetical protein VKZ82_20620 [Nonomuraea sp.]|uniref:hypothetical protein n=1 Tax=Nonomuraea sp. NPDC049649 TaxID=3155776 RepID=UPI002CE5BFB7|nr:hypothetical protein [Nonomuraea sp.]
METVGQKVTYALLEAHSLPPGDEIRLVVLAEKGGSFHTQSQPCVVMRDEQLRCPELYVGDPDSKNEKYTMMAVQANDEVAREFMKYLLDAEARGYPGIGGLPDDARILHDVKVQRHSSVD